MIVHPHSEGSSLSHAASQSGPESACPGDSPSGPGEYRLFYLSPFALRVERDILRRRHEKGLTELLMEAELLVRANQELWQQVDGEKKLPGLVLSAMSASLDRVRDLLTDAADLCGHWQEVPRERTRISGNQNKDNISLPRKRIPSRKLRSRTPPSPGSRSGPGRSPSAG